MSEKEYPSDVYMPNYTVIVRRAYDDEKKDYNYESMSMHEISVAVNSLTQYRKALADKNLIFEKGKNYLCELIESDEIDTDLAKDIADAFDVELETMKTYVINARFTARIKSIVGTSIDGYDFEGELSYNGPGELIDSDCDIFDVEEE